MTGISAFDSIFALLYLRCEKARLDLQHEEDIKWKFLYGNEYLYERIVDKQNKNKVN